MATLGQVLGAVQQQIVAAANFIQNVAVGVDFPSVKVLEQTVTAGTTAVAILDRGLSVDSTRWKPMDLGETLVPATLTTSLSGSVIPVHGSIALTLGGSVSVGDAVSLVLSNPAGAGGPATFTAQWAVVVSGIAGDTPTTMAAKLAAAVNADAILSGWVKAVAAGAVVALTGVVISGIISAASFVGNGGTRLVEIGRRRIDVQIAVWTATIEARDVISDAIEGMFTEMRMMRSAFPGGLPLPDGTVGIIGPVRSHNIDDATLSDAYRRDFMVSIDYPVTTQDALWSVLAPIAQIQFATTQA